MAPISSSSPISECCACQETLVWVKSSNNSYKNHFSDKLYIRIWIRSYVVLNLETNNILELPLYSSIFDCRSVVISGWIFHYWNIVCQFSPIILCMSWVIWEKFKCLDHQIILQNQVQLLFNSSVKTNISLSRYLRTQRGLVLVCSTLYPWIGLSKDIIDF